ncbi:MAG TPA: oligopeptide/dipeptide ABC transporter ATP-binding protein [Candidatus Tectomicrobia bacterium]|nr:oligopeptide/dipeptide ABC transporter ATP-binding protein [Candidatus Tectomicrobia bacterium]
MPTDKPLLDVQQLTKHYALGGGPLSRLLPGHHKRMLRAVDGVSFAIAPTETLGLVGESGCGKTTTGRLILRAIDPTAGRIVFDGQDITALSGKTLQPFRRQSQIVFQDPYSSLNPRLRVRRIIGEPMLVHGLTTGDAMRHDVDAVLDLVGLSPEHAERYPHELSGGQRQRVGIARALGVRPKLIVADEAVSALDVSVRAQILNLLVELRERLGLAYLFISHDLGVVRFISHRVAVMYLGKLVESGPAVSLFAKPLHPYSQALLAAIPKIGDGSSSMFDQTARLLSGELSNPIDLPPGCRFYNRCPYRMERCRLLDPELATVESAHAVACHLYE